MTYELLGITILWTFLFGYLVIASVDFGAGFYSYYAKITNKSHIIHGIIQRYLSPVWEVTNVFLVFFLIGMYGFFPDTAYYFGSALLIPGSIAIVLLSIRGSYYAFSTYGAKDSHVFTFLYGATGLLIPASLTVILTISLGGYVEVQNDHVQLVYSELFTSAYSWSVVILAIVSVLFISASFLTYYASRANDERALNLLRKYAITWAFPTIIMGVIVFLVLSKRNMTQFENMLEIGWVFILSFMAFVGAVVLIWRRERYGTAFGLVVAQYFLAFFGYGVAHLPYLLYPYVTIYDGFTNEAMAIALIVAFIAGLLMLIPSLYLLLRLFLFDADYVRGEK